LGLVWLGVLFEEGGECAYVAGERLVVEGSLFVVLCGLCEVLEFVDDFPFGLDEVFGGSVGARGV